MKTNIIVIVACVLLIAFKVNAQKKPKVTLKELGKTPYTSLNFLNSEDDFQFAIVSDRTGGHRKGVFLKGIKKINLVQPEFIMSVGDLIEGYTTDEKEIIKQWEEMDSFIAQAKMPFFYVAGNHDYSNEEMAKIWKQRLGADYYSFRYKDVLFLCLNTEVDFMFGKKGHGMIDKEQYEYFSKELDKNTDVKWVFLFLHQPLWEHQKTGYWKQLQKKLSNFKHTAFAGHLHNYNGKLINNNKYITLGTTGGGSGLRGKAFGETDHFTLVKFTDGKPIISNILLNGIEQWNFVNGASDKVFQSFKQTPPVYISPQFKTENYALNNINLVLNNTFDYPMQTSVKAIANPKLNINLTEINETVAPHTKKTINIPVKVLDNSYYTNTTPITLMVKGKFNKMGNNVANNWDENISFQPQKQYRIGTNTKKIVLDGNVSEWEKLPYKIEDKTGRSTATAKFGVVEQGDYIYFAVDVIDENIDFSGGISITHGEAFLFSLDVRDKATSSFNAGELTTLLKKEWALLATALTGEKGKLAYKDLILPKDADGIYKLTKKGYQAEFKYPKSEIVKKQGENWDNIRINASIIDRKNGHSIPVSWKPEWKKGLLGTGIFLRNK